MFTQELDAEVKTCQDLLDKFERDPKANFLQLRKAKNQLQITLEKAPKSFRDYDIYINANKIKLAADKVLAPFSKSISKGL